jgi:hypothetical protein
MGLPEKRAHYDEISKRFDQMYKDVLSIRDTNNPFAQDIEDSYDNIYNVFQLYKKFDKLRNSVPYADKIQKNFETFLVDTEEIIEGIRKSSESLIDSGIKFGSIDESKAIEFGKAIAQQVKKFRTWLRSSVKRIKKLHEMLKDDMSMLEKEIQKEFSKIK